MALRLPSPKYHRQPPSWTPPGGAFLPAPVEHTDRARLYRAEKRAMPKWQGAALELDQTKRASDWRLSPGSALSEPPRSQRPSRIRRFFDRAVTSRLGSGSCRDKIRPAASRSLARSPNRAIATCVASWSLEPVPSCGVHASSRRSIPGSYSFSLGDRSRWRRSPLPIRWRGSPGRCWPREGPIGRLGLRQHD